MWQWWRGGGRTVRRFFVHRRPVAAVAGWRRCWVQGDRGCRCLTVRRRRRIHVPPRCPSMTRFAVNSLNSAVHSTFGILNIASPSSQLSLYPPPGRRNFGGSSVRSNRRWRQQPSLAQLFANQSLYFSRGNPSDDCLG